MRLLLPPGPAGASEALAGLGSRMPPQEVLAVGWEAHLESAEKTWPVTTKPSVASCIRCRRAPARVPRGWHAGLRALGAFGAAPFALPDEDAPEPFEDDEDADAKAGVAEAHQKTDLLAWLDCCDTTSSDDKASRAHVQHPKPDEECAGCGDFPVPFCHRCRKPRCARCRGTWGPGTPPWTCSCGILQGMLADTMQSEQCPGLCSRCRINRCFKRVLHIGIPGHLCWPCYVGDWRQERPSGEEEEHARLRADVATGRPGRGGIADAFPADHVSLARAVSLARSPKPQSPTPAQCGRLS